MTVLHFVRHGETVWHHENRYAGSSDVALTDRGWVQASALAEWAAETPIGRVLSSDLSRAVGTARLSADALGVDLEIDPRLREVDFGRGEGLTTEQMREAFPAERAAFEAMPATTPLPGGESGRSAVARAGAVLVELAASGTETLVVAHTTLGRLLLCHLIGLPLDSYRRTFPSVGNGTVTTFRLPPVESVDDLAGTAQLLRFNAPVAAAR